MSYCCLLISYQFRELGLDYFQARYYGAAFGRFTSPDPGNAGADLTNPQSWNAYSYVGNNPLAYTDPSGMIRLADILSGIGNFFGNVGSGISNFLGFGDDGLTRCVSFSGGSCGGGTTRSETSGDGGGAGSSLGGVPLFQAETLGKTDVSNASTPPTQKLQQSAPPKNGPSFTKIFLPGDLFQVCAVGKTSFYAPYSFDIAKIEATGHANGLNPLAVNANVGHYGTFDFQRSRDSAGNTTFYAGFTPVSNFNVGVYMQSAGYSRPATTLIANGFALLRSSNFGDPAQAQYRNLGYDTAAKGQTPFCMNPD